MNEPQKKYISNDEVMEVVRECAKGVPMGFRSETDSALTSNYVKDKIKEELGLHVIITSMWDSTLTMSMARAVMRSPYNRKILNFHVNL